MGAGVRRDPDRRRESRRHAGRRTVAVTALAVLAVTGLIGAGVGCDAQDPGEPTTESFEVSAFGGVDVGSRFDATVTVRVGAARSVEVRTGENAMDDVDVSVAAGVLTLRARDSVTNASTPLEAAITAPSIEWVAAGDRARVAATGLSADIVTATVSDDARATLAGTASSLDATLSDAARLNASGLAAADVTVTAADGSRAEVSASRSLHVTASGGARVTYSGSATLAQTTSGAASVAKR
jgi:hypothetical protein